MSRDLRIVLAEPAGGTDIGLAVAHLGCGVDELAMGTVDAHSNDPERIAAKLFPDDRGTAIVVALAAGSTGGSEAVDWAGHVHVPLHRCFTIVRGLVPSLLDRGGQVVVALPSAALIADREQCAASVLGRSALGLFEGLRAELLSSKVKVSLLLFDSGEAAVGLADRLTRILADASFYSLPRALTEARIDEVFGPWLEALEGTPVNRNMPPMGPMGEVYGDGSDGFALVRQV